MRVGWVKGLNRLYFLYEAYDNYWDFARTGPAQRHLRSRGGRRSLGRAADRPGTPRRLDPGAGRGDVRLDPRSDRVETHWAIHGVQAQNYHIFTPAEGKDWAMAWGCQPWIKELP